MTRPQIITSPADSALDDLCRALANGTNALDAVGHWPREQLALCADYGVYRWFLPEQWGGLGWDGADIARGYVSLGAACMTTAFILTQRQAACRRIECGENDVLKRELLPALAAGEKFTTVGISHLTTSRRHLAKPCLAARESSGGFVLDGYSPWVTGAALADVIVVGATLDDGREILLALPRHLPGVEAEAPAPLVALNASHTGKLLCRDVLVDCRWLLSGPVEHVIQRAAGGGTGGLPTSALALGLAQAAIGYLEREAQNRRELSEPADSLRNERERLLRDLFSLAAGKPACSLEEMRAAANSLVLRATQAALTGAKGAGYVQGHPVGRWCREALFFLVWSCPQAVAAANLCELAGVEG
jgi:alkylation response protein AidB-like acyl-CoA dehydrogenase